MKIGHTGAMEPFKKADEAQRFIAQKAYEHFRNTGEWPHTRDFDIDYGDVLDPVGGLELLCRQRGHERIVCGSPTSEHDRVALTIRGLAACEGSEGDVSNFLAAVRFAARRYRDKRGKDATVTTADLVAELGLDEIAAKRTLQLLSTGDSLTQSSSPAGVTLALPVSRLLNVQTLEDYFGGVAAEQERRLAIAQVGLPRRQPARQPVKRIFLSHAADDGSLAHFLADTLKRGRSDLHVFVASRTGDIPTGEEWLSVIKTELKQADSYLLLLTPRSVRRLWIWYETGAAWMSERQLIPVTTAGLAKGDVPYPLAAHQALSLDDPADATQLARDVGSSIPDPERFCETVRELCKALPAAQDNEADWQGVLVGSRYFAWDGPQLHAIADRAPIPAPDVAIKALKTAGHTPSFGRRDRLRWAQALGVFQVFETDRNSWRRELLYAQDGDQVLLVQPATV